MSELTQFDSEKSMIRYLPPNGTAGLARTEDRMDSRSPSPPARISAIVRFTCEIVAPGIGAPDQQRVKISSAPRLARQPRVVRACLSAGGTGAG